MEGRITRPATGAGYGFITTAAGQEFFFNQSALKGTQFGELSLDSHVLFEAKGRDHGDRADEQPRAVNVHLADDEVPAVDNDALPIEKVMPEAGQRSS